LRLMNMEIILERKSRTDTRNDRRIEIRMITTITATYDSRYRHPILVEPRTVN